MKLIRKRELFLFPTIHYLILASCKLLFFDCSFPPRMVTQTFSVSLADIHGSLTQNQWFMSSEEEKMVYQKNCTKHYIKISTGMLHGAVRIVVFSNSLFRFFQFTSAIRQLRFSFKKVVQLLYFLFPVTS